MKPVRTRRLTAARTGSTASVAIARLSATPCQSGVTYGDPLDEVGQLRDREERAAEDEHRRDDEPEERRERVVVLASRGERLDRRREGEARQHRDREHRDRVGDIGRAETATMTARKTIDPKSRRSPTQVSCPNATCHGDSGARIIAT